jgi:hypothetical protein
MRTRTGVAVSLLALLLPQLSLGQSFLGTQGLGFPLEPLDARARALGSIGVGLRGAALVPTDPAAATGLLVPTVNISLQPHWGSGSVGAENLKSQGTRFPLIGIAYPVSAVGGMVTLTFGGLLDQRWEVEEEGVTDLGGTPTPTVDFFKSEGGVSSLRLGWAQNLGGGVSLAMAVGSHLGSVTRTFTRTFDPEVVATEVVDFTDGGKWTFSGLSTSFGAGWNLGQFFRFGGSLILASELKAKPATGTEGEPATYDLPMELRLGATGVLTPRLSLHFGAAYADWKTSEGGLGSEAVVGQVWSFGGGVEWTGLEMGSRTLPLRFGYRRAGLPFRFQDEDPVERAFSTGMGLNLTQVEELVLAGVDLGVERGSRDAGSLSESFWRATLTFRVSGW